MRLFTAITIPEEIKARLHELFIPIEGVKWQDKSQMHLTLRFIGEVDTGTAGKIIDEIDEVQVPPFDITLAELGTFPERGKPKVIWVGVEHSEMLHELYDRLDEACQHAGLEPDNRSFKPHITLGRNKGKATQEIRKYLAHQDVPNFDPIYVSEFCLFSSELTPKGAIYHLEKKFPLH